MRGVHKPGTFVPIKMGLVAVFAVASACSSAFGQDHLTWRCDVPNGRFVQNPQSISPTSNALSGQIQFDGSRFGEQWNPTAHVAFTDSKLPTNGDCFCNGIRASIYPSEPETVKFFMIYNGQSEGIAQAPVGKPITFRMSIDEGGVLTVAIGKTNPAVKTAQLFHVDRDTMQLSCSSGNVNFLNVQAE